MNSVDFLEIQKILLYKFRNRRLLYQAFTHRSYAHERCCGDKPDHFERLEFIGDKVIGLYVVEKLFLKPIYMTEHHMTDVYAYITSNKYFAGTVKKSVSDIFII